MVATGEMQAIPTVAKIRRELQRIGHAAADSLTALAEPRRVRGHDRAFAERVRIVAGVAPETERIAIFVLFQPAGLSASTVETCRYLVAQGYAPLVLSNAPLVAEDCDRLRPVTWLLALRPNYGYDFGAYRDGVKLLEMRGARPGRLVILNDSIWFPLHETATLLAEMERAGPFCGPMFDRKEGRRHPGHFESYLISLGREALESPTFTTFWHSFVPSDQRRIVLRRGEKGFSRALIEGGVPPAILASRAAFTNRIAGLDDEGLRKALTYAAYEMPADAEAGRTLLAGRLGGFRKAAVGHIGRVAAKQNVQESFVWAAMTLFDLPFLKKRMKPLTVEMRRQYLRAVTAGDLPPPCDMVLAEIRTSVPGPP